MFRDVIPGGTLSLRIEVMIPSSSSGFVPTVAYLWYFILFSLSHKYLLAFELLCCAHSVITQQASDGDWWLCDYVNHGCKMTKWSKQNNSYIEHRFILNPLNDLCEIIYTNEIKWLNQQYKIYGIQIDKCKYASLFIAISYVSVFVWLK